MRGDALGVFGSGIGRQPDLGKHGIAIQEELERDARGFIAKPAGAGDIGEHIRRSDDFFGFGGICDAVIFFIGDIAVNPAIPHAELLHDAG